MTPLNRSNYKENGRQHNGRVVGRVRQVESRDASRI